jgi:transposase
VDVVFPHLAAVQVDSVAREDGTVLIAARSRGDPVPCPVCGTMTGKVHGYYRRRLADTPAGGTAVVLELTLRRLVCRNYACPQQTFHEQIPGLAERYARRTPPVTQLVTGFAIVLAGRAAATLLAASGVVVSSTAVLAALMALPDPVRPTPAVVGVDDFALARSRRYASIIIDAVTHEPIEVLPDRLGVTFEAWLRAHPGVRVICRDRSTAYAAGSRDGAPDAVQIADRWHVWKNLVEAVHKTATMHRACSSQDAAGSGRGERPIAKRTRARHAAVHALHREGLSNNAIARRLHLGLNTVKKYLRAEHAGQLIGGPRYRSTLVDPFRDYLRHRLAQDPHITVCALLGELKAMGYQGEQTLLYRYLGQGRANDEHPPPSPRRLTSWITTDPAELTDSTRTRLEHTLKHCPHLTAAAEHVRAFAELLTRERDGDLTDCAARLDQWIAAVRADDLPAVHSFAEGLLIDRDAVIAGLTLPHSNGPTEGTVNKIKLIKRQMYGRAGFSLLRKRILHA